MEGGPPGFPQGFTCPAVLGNSLGWPSVSDTGLSPAVAGLSRPFSYRQAMPCRAPATPGSKLPGLASSAFARHYLRNLVLMSSPSGTEMFHFPESRPARLFDSARGGRQVAGRVSPFGHPRIKACYGSPWIFAVCCVLHRLMAPRHPSCARIRLTETDLSGSRCIRCNSSYPKTMLFSRNCRRREARLAGPAASRNKSVSEYVPPGGRSGGRDWNRTSDLVLIRDAL